MVLGIKHSKIGDSNFQVADEIVVASGVIVMATQKIS